MAKTTGLGERLFLNEFDLSGDVGALGTIGTSQGQQELPSLRDAAQRRLGLLKDASLAYTAYFDAAAGGSHPVLSTLPQSALVSWFTGTAAGDQTGSMIANATEYTPTRGADGSLVAAIAAQANATGMEWGVAGTTGDQTFASAAAGTYVDDYVPVFPGLALPSTLGLIAYLHVISIGSGTATVHVQDSTANVTYTDISGGVFTGASGPTSQRLVIPGNINRYLKINVAGTFSNAVIAVALARVITA